MPRVGVQPCGWVRGSGCVFSGCAFGPCPFVIYCYNNSFHFVHTSAEDHSVEA